jgi:hypothetical protein
MRKSGSRSASVLLMLLSLSPVLAQADAIPFTGTANFGGDQQSFLLSGPSLLLSSAAPGATAAPFLACSPGTPCDPTWTVSAFFTLSSGFSSGTVGTLSAQTLSGFLTFPGEPFIAPVFPVGVSDNEVTVPVSLVGAIRGYEFLPPGCLSDCTGNPVFDLALTGTGSVTLHGFAGSSEPPGSDVDRFRFAHWTFSGEATVVPEPSTVVLLGSGLAYAAVRLRKRRLMQDGPLRAASRDANRGSRRGPAGRWAGKALV